MVSDFSSGSVILDVFTVAIAAISAVLAAISKPGSPMASSTTVVQRRVRRENANEPSDNRRLIKDYNLLMRICLKLFARFLDAGIPHDGYIFAEGGGQVDLMVLFIYQNLSDLLGHGVFT